MNSESSLEGPVQQGSSFHAAAFDSAILLRLGHFVGTQYLFKSICPELGNKKGNVNFSLRSHFGEHSLLCLLQIKHEFMCISNVEYFYLGRSWKTKHAIEAMVFLVP